MALTEQSESECPDFQNEDGRDKGWGWGGAGEGGEGRSFQRVRSLHSLYPGVLTCTFSPLLAHGREVRTKCRKPSAAPSGRPAKLRARGRAGERERHGCEHTFWSVQAGRTPLGSRSCYRSSTTYVIGTHTAPVTREGHATLCTFALDPLKTRAGCESHRKKRGTAIAKTTSPVCWAKQVRLFGCQNHGRNNCSCR